MMARGKAEVAELSQDILLTRQLVLVARRWRALLDDKLRPIEQSAARMEALSAIYNSPALPVQVDIARRLRIEGPTLTRMLDTLEKDGLVERLTDPGDRRSKRLRLTPAGEEALVAINTIAQDFRARLLDAMPQAQKDELGAVLDMMMARLDAGLEASGG